MMYVKLTKNDSKDSLVILRIMRFSEFSIISLVGEDIMALRQLSNIALTDNCFDWKRKYIVL